MKQPLSYVLQLQQITPFVLELNYVAVRLCTLFLSLIMRVSRVLIHVINFSCSWFVVLLCSCFPHYFPELHE